MYVYDTLGRNYVGNMKIALKGPLGIFVSVDSVLKDFP